MTSTLERRLRVGRPIWLRSSTQPRRRYPALHQDYDVDVAVVGGGITGALVATLFAGAGIDVAVLEAHRVGEGSTAASTGLLLKEPDSGLIALTRRYGFAAARRIWGLCESGTRDLIALVRDLRVPCDLVDCDSVYFTTCHEGIAALKAEFDRRQAAGFPQRWLSSRMLRETTAITGPGAIRTPGCARLNSYEACVGLMEAAREAGARIFESSQVRRIDRMRRGVRVTCDHGVVRASRVVVATGYATASFKPLAGRFQLAHTYVMATKPVSKRLRRELGLDDVMLWDTERPYHYARWTRDHRLLLGGADRAVLPGHRRAVALRDGMHALHDYFVSIFPTIAAIGIEYGWEGLFATTPDGLPYVGPHRRYPRHLFALGYGGNGMTFAYLAARMLLEHLTGVDSPDHRLFAFSRPLEKSR